MTLVLTGGEPWVVGPEGPIDGGPGAAVERIVDAALRCIAKWGLNKTTLDDVAREAGCARATVYRVFPGGRDAVFEAVVATEARRFFARVSVGAQAATNLEDVLVVAIVEASKALSEHAALQFLLAHEPEAILPHLAFHHMDSVLRLIAARGAPLLAPWLPAADSAIEPAGEAAARLAEWVARIVISYITSPSTGIDLRESDSARAFVHRFILPGVAPVAALSVSST